MRNLMVEILGPWGPLEVVTISLTTAIITTPITIIMTATNITIEIINTIMMINVSIP